MPIEDSSRVFVVRTKDRRPQVRGPELIKLRRQQREARWRRAKRRVDVTAPEPVSQFALEGPERPAVPVVVASRRNPKKRSGRKVRDAGTDS
jgi:hypothetical protein